MRRPARENRFLKKYIGGNRVRLLRNGDETFPAMLDAIAQAKHTICLETYILRADKTGRAFADALIKAAQRGVEINFMYDAVGSLGLPHSFVSGLRQVGIHVVEYGPIRWFNIKQLNKRNHRKSLIVDSRICFLGGINIADANASVEKGGEGWRDTHIEIAGPAAVELEKIFLRTWRRSSGMPISEELYARPCENAGDVRVRILGNRLLKERYTIRGAYLRAISLATKRVCITNAYFLPDPVFVRALIRAANRGARVEIISGGTTSDVPLVGYAGNAIFGKLLRKKIRIFEWQDKVLHAKTASVDGQWSTIGSYNLDYRSLWHNLEANAGILDAGVSGEVEEMFDDDLKKTKELTLEKWKNRSWVHRLRDWFAYHFRFLL